MIFNLRFNISRGGDNNPSSILGEIHEKLYDILSILHSNPEICLKSVSLTVSLVQHRQKKSKRLYLFLLKTPMNDVNDIISITYFIEQACKVRGIDLSKLDRIFVRLLIVKNKDS